MHIITHHFDYEGILNYNNLFEPARFLLKTFYGPDAVQNYGSREEIDSEQQIVDIEASAEDVQLTAKKVVQIILAIIVAYPCGLIAYILYQIEELFSAESTMDLIKLKNIKRIVGDSKQVMVYGFAHCFYNEISLALREKPYSLHTFSHAVSQNDPNDRTTLEGRVMSRISAGSLDINSCSRMIINDNCKSGLTTLVFENFKRSIQGLHLIPILFCIDINENPFPLNSVNILTKSEKMNIRVTHKELRRAFKLCYDDHVDPRIQNIAQVTFKFVKVTRFNNETYTLEEIPAPWKDPTWPDEWAIRKAQSSPRKAKDWRDALNTFVAQEDANLASRAQATT